MVPFGLSLCDYISIKSRIRWLLEMKSEAAAGSQHADPPRAVEASQGDDCGGGGVRVKETDMGSG